MTRYRVLIVQAMCKQYRAPLFARMYEELASEGIELQVAYSRPLEKHRQRNDDVTLPSAYGIRIRHRAWLGGRIFMQLPYRLIRRADLVIVEHAAKHLINYPLALLSLLRLKKLGVWMHGGTLRHASSPLLRPWRVFSMRGADWIFAYTKGVADAAVALGARRARVTALQNAVDLSDFRRALTAVTPDQIATARQWLGITPEAHVALFCGSLYPGRGLEFLLAAGDRIMELDPQFRLIVIGAGPLEVQLQRGSGTRPWLHALGSIFGEDRAIYFRLARLSLMPYLAGLGILDVMAAGLPFLVTGAKTTNPEIEYLVDGVTGLVTGDSVELFAKAVADLFADPGRLQSMSEAASAASHQYSIEAMASNFCQGIRECLAGPGPGRKA